jgi:hypothetical protein
MGFSIFDLCRALVLILNGMAILNERRFLTKFGIVPPGGVTSSPSVAPVNGNAMGGFGELDFGASLNGGGVASSSGSSGATADGQISVKQQIGQLLFSVRLLLRWPLVIANAVMIVLTIVFG